MSEIDPTEIWKACEQYPRVEVSNTGQVRNVKRMIPYSGSRSRDGYMVMNCRKDAKYQSVYVHRLVAKAFLGAPAEGMTVNHKNGNKSDNRIENLEWISQPDNNRHAHKHLGLLDRVIAGVSKAGRDRKASRTPKEALAMFGAPILYNAILKVLEADRDLDPHDSHILSSAIARVERAVQTDAGELVA